MGFALPALAIASVGLQALGSVQKGVQTQKADNYNAEVARQNAITSERAGQARAMNVGLKAAAEGGRIKAGQAANNIDVNTGSAAQVQSDQRSAGAADQHQTNNEALIQAYGYKAQEGIDRFAGKNALVEGIVGAAGDLAGGASKFGGFGSSSGSATGQALQNSAYAGSYAEEG